MTEEEIREILSGQFLISVKNFKKYNPKNTSQWIRLQHGWHNDLIVRSWSPTTKLLYLILINLQGASRGLPVNLSLGSLKVHVNLPGASLEPRLVRLWNDGFIFLEKNTKDKIRVEKNRDQKEDLKKEPKIKQLLLMPPQKKEGEISSTTQAVEAVFFSFEEIPKQVLKLYKISARGVTTWVDRWGLERVSANLPTAAHKFEITSNHKNPNYRINFQIYFTNWMENQDKKITGGKRLREMKEKKKKEEEPWTLF